MSNKFLPTNVFNIGDIFTFCGRLSRRPYIIRQVIYSFIMLCVMISTMHQILGLSQGGQYPYQGIVILAFAGLLISLSIAMIAQVTKRVRDIGWSIWIVPGFFIGNILLGMVATRNAMPGTAPVFLIILNILSLAFGIALMAIPGKKLEFPDTIYARKPFSLSTITDMLNQIPDAGGNSFITFILPTENASYGPDEMKQMKIVWANLHDHIVKDSEGTTTILRRDATETIRDGQNLTDDRMWIIKHKDAWELTLDETSAAMA